MFAKQPPLGHHGQEYEPFSSVLDDEGLKEVRQDHGESE